MKVVIAVLSMLLSLPALSHEVEERTSESSVVCDATTIIVEPSDSEVPALKCNFEENWYAVYGTDAFEVTAMTIKFAQQRANSICTLREMKRVRYIKNVPAGGVENFAVANLQDQQGVRASVKGVFYCAKEQ